MKTLARLTDYLDVHPDWEGVKVVVSDEHAASRPGLPTVLIDGVPHGPVVMGDVGIAPEDAAAEEPLRQAGYKVAHMASC